MAKELIQAPWANSQVGRAIERELRTGFMLEKQLEKFRVEGAAEEAAEVRKHGQRANAPFKQVAAVPARDFWRLVKKYGHDEVHSKDFIRYLHKKMPELKTANI